MTKTVKNQLSTLVVDTLAKISSEVKFLTQTRNLKGTYEVQPIQFDSHIPTSRFTGCEIFIDYDKKLNMEFSMNDITRGTWCNSASYKDTKFAILNGDQLQIVNEIPEGYIVQLLLSIYTPFTKYGDKVLVYTNRTLNNQSTFSLQSNISYDITL